MTTLACNLASEQNPVPILTEIDRGKLGKCGSLLGEEVCKVGHTYFFSFV
jgi:hypothetical protein